MVPPLYPVVQARNCGLLKFYYYLVMNLFYPFTFVLLGTPWTLQPENLHLFWLWKIFLYCYYSSFFCSLFSVLLPSRTLISWILKLLDLAICLLTFYLYLSTLGSCVLSLRELLSLMFQTNIHSLAVSFLSFAPSTEICLNYPRFQLILFIKSMFL